MQPINYFKITKDPLKLDMLVEKVVSPAIGGIVTFIGTVRNNTENKKVIKLSYEANIEFAESIMKNIFTDIQEQWGKVNIAVAHRIGTDFEVGTITLIIVTAAPHREEAYSANRYILEKIKEDLPVWKKETFSNGEDKWVGWDY